MTLRQWMRMLNAQRGNDGRRRRRRQRLPLPLLQLGRREVVKMTLMKRRRNENGGRRRRRKRKQRSSVNSVVPFDYIPKFASRKK